MAGIIKANSLQLGDSGIADNNFHLKTNVDGSLSLNRGNDGAPSQELIKVNTDGSQEVLGLPAFQCRAWVNFDGTRNVTNTGASVVGQPVFIRGSGNVSSVIKTATGAYNVNFTTPMPDANYSFSLGGHGNTTSSNNGYPTGAPSVLGGYSPTTTFLPIRGVNGANGTIDLDTITVSIFR